MKILKKFALLLALTLMGVIYVSNTWSPSSYSHVLKNHFGYQDAKPDLGSPRPIRSDEWGVVTPLTQATIRNNFQRYNKTSLYQEDLRINYGLPIADWGIIFKPTMWLYGHVNPAYAYSFHWFAIFALFVIGYSFLFKKFDATIRVSIFLSLGLYFTGFSQFWWNEKGPLIAIFPWTIIPFFLNIRFIYKLVLFYYVLVFWLLTNLYPPVQISLVFVGLILLIVMKPGLFKFPKILCILAAAALAAGTAALYLYDYLIATSLTLYPGGRHSMGGGIPYYFFLSWVFPGINFTWNFDSLVDLNISEIGTVGMYYYISVLFFLNYGNFNIIWDDLSKRKIFILLTLGFFMQLIWMVAPIPSRIGMFLLWDNVQPSRMQFASGVLLTFFVFYSANTMGLVFSLPRLFLLNFVIFFVWLIFKKKPDLMHFEDLIFLPLILVFCFFSKNNKKFFHEAIIICSLLFGCILFGRFNPLQPAWSIFNAPSNEVTAHLRKSEENNNGVLVVPGLPGAIANGLGFRSLGHVTPVPQMNFWKNKFPELSADELNGIFNRYAHIIPDLMPHPKLQQADAVGVPVDYFTNVSRAVEIDEYPNGMQKQGHFVIEKKYPDALVLSGWGGWRNPVDFHGIEVKMSPSAVEAVEMVSTIRTDLPMNTNQKISALNGFKIMISKLNGKMPTCLSLIAVDKLSGERSLLENPAEISYCPPSSRE